MTLRTAAYMAITLHFLRELSQKILSPSRKTPGRTLARDQVLVAMPLTGEYRMIRVAKIAKGTDLYQYYSFVREAQRHFDRCCVQVMWPDELDDRARRHGGRIRNYCDIHESNMSTDWKNTFYVSKVLRDMPLSFLKHLEMY